MSRHDLTQLREMQEQLRDIDRRLGRVETCIAEVKGVTLTALEGSVRAVAAHLLRPVRHPGPRKAGPP